MSATENSHGSELRRFLRECRARVDASTFDFGRGKMRRKPGLRREEVAELLGVSNVWYARFERGSARFSLQALNRLAKVFALDSLERERLFTLARPELRDVHAAGLRDTFASLGRSYDETLRLSKSLRSATSTAEAGERVATALAAALDYPGIAFWQRVLPGRHLRFDAVCGMNGEGLLGYVQPACALSPEIQASLFAGNITLEPDLTRSPSAELRSRVDALGTLSYFALGAAIADEPTGALFGFAGFEKRVPTDIDHKVLRTIGALVELTFR